MGVWFQQNLNALPYKEVEREWEKEGNGTMKADHWSTHVRKQNFYVFKYIYCYYRHGMVVRWDEIPTTGISFLHIISLFLSPSFFIFLLNWSRMLCHNLIFPQIIQEINTLQLKRSEKERKRERAKCAVWFCSIGKLMIFKQFHLKHTCIVGRPCHAAYHIENNCEYHHHHKQQ